MTLHQLKPCPDDEELSEAINHTSFACANLIYELVEAPPGSLLRVWRKSTPA